MNYLVKNLLFFFIFFSWLNGVCISKLFLSSAVSSHDKRFFFLLKSLYLRIGKFTNEVSYIRIQMYTRIHWISFLGGIKVYIVFLLASGYSVWEIALSRKSARSQWNVMKTLYLRIWSSFRGCHTEYIFAEIPELHKQALK